MSPPLADGSTVGGVISHSTKEPRMSRFTHNSFALRVAFLTSFISIVSALLPLAAIAGGGDPRGG
jgi:hypothetical protein